MTQTFHVGSSHFQSFGDACRYYRNYGGDESEVRRKIEDGEISIGPPKIQAGESIYLDPSEGRYFIITHA